MKREFKVEGLEDINPNNFGGMVSRSIVLERKEIDFEKGIETIATTENPAHVVDWERWQVIREILPMRYMESPNNDKVPFLDSHSRGSLEKIKGSAKNFKTDGPNLLATVFISESEPELRQKIKEGHIDSVSIGYMTDKANSVEVPQGKTVNIDGTIYRNDFKDNTPLVVRTWWKVHELSGVAIGADELAKFKSVHDIETVKMIDKINSLEKQINEIKNASVETDGKDKSAHSRRLRELKLKQIKQTNYGN